MATVVAGGHGHCTGALIIMVFVGVSPRRASPKRRDPFAIDPSLPAHEMLARFWVYGGDRPKPFPAGGTAVRDLERRYGIVLPEDFRAYLLSVGPEEDHWDIGTPSGGRSRGFATSRRKISIRWTIRRSRPDRSAACTSRLYDLVLGLGDLLRRKRVLRQGRRYRQRRSLGGRQLHRFRTQLRRRSAFGLLKSRNLKSCPRRPVDPGTRPG